MNRDYLIKKLSEAEAELDAARTRSQVDEAAARYQRIKTELRALEAAAKKRPKRGASGARRSADA
jgi:hypothetical protein